MERMSEAERNERTAAGMEAWGAWSARMPALSSIGARRSGKRGEPRRGVEEIRNVMSAYVIVQAESHAAAASFSKKHPHFTVFPGDSVEVMECLPLPG